MNTITCVVVDDHPFYREGVKSMAPLVDPSIAVIGEAGDGESALEVIAASPPDVVLMDLALPGMSGIEATRAIRSAHPGVAVLVLTMLQDDSVFAALEAGAGGYLLKDASIESVCRGIRSVARGELVIAPQSSALLRARLQQAPTVGFPGLTPRENDVLALVGEGHGNAAIARRLHLKPKTARNYVSAVIAKLGVADREAAASLARGMTR